MGDSRPMSLSPKGSRQSFRSFGSTDEIYHQDAREIHLGLPMSFSSPSVTDFIREMSSPSVTDFVREISSPSVTDFVLDFGHDQEVGPTAEPTASEKQTVPQPWAKVIVVMAFTSVVGLLSVSYTINGNGNLIPATLFSGRPVSFGFFLLVVMVTFYISIIAMIIRPVLPLIAKVLNIMAFVCVVLGVTVLLWAMLPKSISWVPWIFFSFTILIAFGVIVYEWFVYVKKVKEKGTTKRPTT
ncbi:uncharacterized protein LOC131258028 isoform X2 [Magnolia sinica]|uniref:uncharacterized protein LOC131258028 isoform X2 n=1 Tax=Magnolia sinica TaxID=86752 RepID=UPI00265A0F44|nr:uncharacterized protein LOC131258028 isoform X2 [Magnolia sinica]